MSSDTDVPALSKYDLILLVDATYSMGQFLKSLQTSLPQIISISALTDCFSRIGLLAYRDYSDGEKIRIEWSGWYDGSQSTGTQPDLEVLAKNLEPRGGGDFPEALKTALAKAYQEMRADASTIILLFADAPPHTAANGGPKSDGSNYYNERAALAVLSSYGGNGPGFLDWVDAAQVFATGPKKAQVFSVIETGLHPASLSFFVYLSSITNGCCLKVGNVPLSISKTTVELLLAWMSVEKMGSNNQAERLPARICRYKSLDGITNITNESDANASRFFATPSDRGGEACAKNLLQDSITTEELKEFVVKKQDAALNFSERYKKDHKYRETVARCLKSIIEQDIVSISLNPVFGSLWRVFCNDREGEHRQDLTTRFGLAVDRIPNTEEKARMKTWLEESYDYTGEVLEIINSVPSASRYPCACLDPTLVFGAPKENHNEDENLDEANTNITAFRRDELLEIGRSCDYKILKRLGKVLTRLTIIESAETVPEHIAATTDENVPKIPLILASKEYNFQFWKILLHVVVPGTFLSARSSALVAALCIRMGVQPLMGVAIQQVLSQRNRWNDLEVPENWNLSCLSHLLDADKIHRKMMANQEGEQQITLLKEEDKTLFEKVVAYKMLERNLDTTLTAIIGWTPQKSTLPIGPLSVCKACEYPRSVTIMGKDGKCGHCLSEWDSDEEKEEYIHAHVSKEDTPSTQATWVECNLRTCRSQYVVYRPEKLNVRPKCHYCRTATGPAPWVACKKCSNRMIWPLEYRPSDMKSGDVTDFQCVACSAERKTLVEVEATTQELILENGRAWLLRNEIRDADPGVDTTSGESIEVPFDNRTLYNTIKTLTPTYFTNLTLFPSVSPPHASWPLVLKGKPIYNAPALIDALKTWVYSRRTQSATCTLCFSTSRKDRLVPACGRRGCLQRLDADCLRSWYGINRPGAILNLAAVHCPFCRRMPVSKTLATYGAGVHAVGGLAEAQERRGEWVYAWCAGCVRARPFAERVCMGDAEAPQVERWRCDDCAAGGGVKVRDCPSCGVTTERTGGCGHMQCTGCGSHWCWFCGKSPDGDIYAHMGDEHGGMFGGEDQNYSEDEYDTDGTDN